MEENLYQIIRDNDGNSEICIHLKPMESVYTPFVYDEYGTSCEKARNQVKVIRITEAAANYRCIWRSEVLLSAAFYICAVQLTPWCCAFLYDRVLSEFVAIKIWLSDECILSDESKVKFRLFSRKKMESQLLYLICWLKVAQISSVFHFASITMPKQSL